MSRLLLDMVGKECSIAILGILEIKGIIMDVDDKWIKFKYTQKWIKFKYSKKREKE